MVSHVYHVFIFCCSHGLSCCDVVILVRGWVGASVCASCFSSMYFSSLCFSSLVNHKQDGTRVHPTVQPRPSYIYTQLRISLRDRSSLSNLSELIRKAQVFCTCGWWPNSSLCFSSIILMYFSSSKRQWTADWIYINISAGVNPTSHNPCIIYQAKASIELKHLYPTWNQSMRDQSVDGAEAHPMYQNSFAKLKSSTSMDGHSMVGSSIEST